MQSPVHRTFPRDLRGNEGKNTFVLSIPMATSNVVLRANVNLSTSVWSREVHSFTHLLWPASNLLSLSLWWLLPILDSNNQARGGDTESSFLQQLGHCLNLSWYFWSLPEILWGVSENESGWQHDFQETTSPIFQSLKKSCFSVGRMVICFPSWVFYPMTFKWLLSIPSHSWELHGSYRGFCSLPFPLWCPLSAIFLLQSLKVTASSPLSSKLVFAIGLLYHTHL